MEKKKSVLSLDAWVAIAIIGIIAVLSLEGFARQDIPELAARFPMFVFAIVAATGLAEVVRCVSARKRENREAEERGGTAPERKPVFHNVRNFLVISALIVVYSVLMHLIGFIASTILFFIAFVLHFKFKRMALYCVCSAAGVVAVYFCFTELMHIRLPIGELVEKFL